MNLMLPSDEDRSNPWALIRRANKFDGPYFRVCSDTVTHGGRTVHLYDSVRMKRFGLAIVPIDQDGNTTLVGQYRYVLDKYTWEVTRGGGPIDISPLEAAKAELSEETGYWADHWLQIFAASASPGTSDEIAIGFVAWSLSTGEPHPEEGERLARLRLPFREAVGKVLSGEISDLGSAALLLAIEAKRSRRQLPLDLARLL